MHSAKFKSLLKKLDSTDASKRRGAAEELAEGDERAIYPLIKALRDDNLGVQDAAMRSLMSIKGEATAYMVLPLLRENSFLRNTALIILKEMGDITVPLLPVLLKDRDDDIRKFALDLIYDIGHCDYPDSLVSLLTDDPNANVRASAAKAIGRLRYKDGVQPLISSLKDEEWVCFSSLEALTVINDERAIDPIVGLLENGSETVRYAAIEALGKIGSRRANGPLIKHFSKVDGLEQNATIKSIAQTGNIPALPGISEALINILINDEWEDKFIAIKGLVSLKETKSIYHMIDIAGSLDLSDPDNEEKFLIMREAVQSFGCAKTLIDLLNDQSIKYRGKVIAIELAGSMKCREAVTVLVKLLNSEYRDVRRSSIKSLGEIGAPDARDSLIEAIEDEDSHVRKSAVIALGKIGDMSAFEPLMKMLHKENYNDVIDEFIRSLCSINSALFISRINEFRDDIRDAASRYAADFSKEVTC